MGKTHDGDTRAGSKSEPAIDARLWRVWRRCQLRLNHIGRFLARVHAILAPLSDLRLSFVLIALGGFILLGVDPGRDVVRGLSDNTNAVVDGWHFTSHAGPVFVQWFAFLFACIWTGLNAWYWANILYKTQSTVEQPCWFRWVRRSLGLAPLVFAMIAIAVTSGWQFGQVWLPLILFGLSAAAMVSFFHWRTRPGQSDLVRFSRNFATPASVQPSAGAGVPLVVAETWFIAASVALSLLLLGLLMIPGWRTSVAWTLGPAALAFGAIGCIIPMTSLAIWGTRQARIPVIAIGGVCFLLFSFVNDNHKIRTLGQATAPRITIDQAFWDWNIHHPNQMDPIVIVATAGGASRAAYWTGTVLRTLDDRLGGHFGSSVFAISSVSGGSLGAVGYASWVADHQPSPQSATKAAGIERLQFVHGFLGADYLAPAIGGLLFPDLMQRFFFLPVFPDRAISLEESWEQGWVTMAEGCKFQPCPKVTRLADDFRDIWAGSLGAKPDAATPWIPILLLNGTDADDGKRIITAPVAITQNVFPDSYGYFAMSHARIRASTAALNSARFPIVSPAGRIGSGFWTPGHVVDGGYFENGGLETANDLARHLHTLSPRQIVIVEINNDDQQGESDQARGPQPVAALETPKPTWFSPFFEEAGAIVGGLYQTRSARGILAAKRLSVDYGDEAGSVASYYRFRLPKFGSHHTSMSWALSLSSRDAMDVSFGVPENDTTHLVASRHYSPQRASAIANDLRRMAETCDPKVAGSCVAEQNRAQMDQLVGLLRSQAGGAPSLLTVGLSQNR